MYSGRVQLDRRRGRLADFPRSAAAATCDLYTGERKLTNVFSFTFASDRPLKRHVLPRSYRQTMQWLDAQRRRAVGIEVRKGYEQAA